MNYRSTRGGSSNTSFEQVLLSGYCSDGGLFMPSYIPKIDTNILRGWAHLSYTELVKQLLPIYISSEEIPLDDLSSLIDVAFSCFEVPGTVELVRLKNGLNILELFHGPTLAFKDLGLSCVAQLLNYFLIKRGTHSTVLVGTSGDTGSSAMEAVRGLDSVDIIVLFPRGRCYPIQELQMTTIIENNVHIFSVDGSSDELDEPIKQCFSDPDFVTTHNLCTINSINWGRILVQLAHFFYAYLQMCPDCVEELEVVVPTGALGNVAAGCIAKQMGLPIHMMCTVNCNDVVSRLIDTGVYSIEGSLVKSLANAMDIQIAPNMDRLLWLFSDGNCSQVCDIMTTFNSSKRVVLPELLHRRIRETLSSHRVTDDAIKRTMTRCWEENQYLICPHSATAVDYYFQIIDQNLIQSTEESTAYTMGCIDKSSRDDSKSLSRSQKIYIATASPEKFEEVISSVGLTVNLSEALQNLFTAPTKFEEMSLGEDWYEKLKRSIIEITDRRKQSIIII